MNPPPCVLRSFCLVVSLCKPGYITRIHEIATIPDGKWQQSEGSQMVF